MPCCSIAQIGGSPAGGAVVPVPLQGAIVANIDPAGPVGSVDVQVALFNDPTVALGTVPLASWLTRTDSPTLGTVLEITQSGVYSILMFVPWGAGFNVGNGVSLNATVAQRQAIGPEPVQPEIYASDFQTNSSIQGLPAEAVLVINASMIASGQNLIRGLVWNPLAPGGPLPGAAFVNGPASCLRIVRVGNTD